MAGLSPPLIVIQSIARAKSLFCRDEPIRGLDAFITGLELYEPAHLLGKARYQVEVLVQECVQELNREAHVRDILAALTKSPKSTLAYSPGNEDNLLNILGILRKALMESKKNKEAAAAQELEDRKNSLRARGRDHLNKGDAGRGKATLRVLADEYGHEPGVLLEIGQWLQDAKLLFEALEFYEAAMQSFPKEAKAYQGAAFCAVELHEADKAVEVYMQALRQFGKHPKTLFNLAKAHMMAKNRDKAFEFAQAAYKADPSNLEAKEMADKLA